MKYQSWEKKYGWNGNHCFLEKNSYSKKRREKIKTMRETAAILHIPLVYLLSWLPNKN